MRLTVPSIGLAVFLLFFFTGTAEGAKSLQSFSVGGRTLPVYASASLTTIDTLPTRAAIILHGSSENATDYYNYGATAVPASTFLVAPRFRSTSSGTDLYWSGGTWKEGAYSTNTPNLSSFAVMDALISQIESTRPNVTTIVLLGHSAGGQFVQRYASTSTNPKVKFVAANPGSYMYLTTTREGYSNPASGCTSYNRYRYGLEQLNPYLNSIGAATLTSRYRATTMTYLLGELDTDPNDPDLDTGCAATRQGPYRLERGLRFHRSLGTTSHIVLTVPGVGHQGKEIINSVQGKAALAQ